MWSQVKRQKKSRKFNSDESHPPLRGHCLASVEHAASELAVVAANQVGAAHGGGEECAKKMTPPR